MPAGTGGVRGEDAAGAHDLDCLGERQAGLDQLADPFQRQEPGMPLVGVEDLRVQAEGTQGANAADAEHDLLTHPVLDVAAVEAIGDGRDLGGVGVDGGVEEVQVDAPDHDLPHVEPGDVVAHVDRHLHARRSQRQAVRVEPREALLLVAVGVETLAEVALGVQQADGNERQPEIGGRLEVVAGENAEAAGVLRQRLGQAELRREVGDEFERAVLPALEPPWLGHRLGQTLGGGVGERGDLVVAGELLPPACGDSGDQAQRIVPAGLPQRRFQLGEQRLRLAVPGPVDVGGQFGERLETRWDGGNDVELADSAHSGEFSPAMPRPACPSTVSAALGLAVYAQRGGGNRIPRVPAGQQRGGLGAHGVGELGMGQHLGDAVGQGDVVAGLEQHPRARALDDLGETAGAGHDGRRAGAMPSRATMPNGS